MTLIKDGKLIDDQFVVLADDDALPDGQAVLVSLERWQAGRHDLIAHNGLVGVRLHSDQSADLIGDELEHLAVISVEFPTFSDGRGFSTARSLREHYSYTGEIRATGHLIRDQYLFMHRCGINAIEVTDQKDLPEWKKAMEEISLFYQSTADDRVPVMFERQKVTAAE